MTDSITFATLGCIVLATIAPTSAFVGSHSHSHSHSHSDSQSGKDVHGNDFCVDISRYGHVAVNVTWKEVYDTCDVRQVCTLRNEEVCGDVTDLKCDIVAYTECKTTEVEEKCTKPAEEIRWADQWWCEESHEFINHTKTMPQCHNVTKQNCVSKWEMDDQGNKFWAGNEECEPVTWQECTLKPIQSKFEIPKVDCRLTEKIPYCDHKQVDSTRKRTTVTCAVKSTQSCKPVPVRKCTTITWQDCHDVPVTGNASYVPIYEPYQEKLHLQKCLLPNL